MKRNQRSVGGAQTDTPAAQFRRYLMNAQAEAMTAATREADHQKRAAWQAIQQQLRAAQQAAQEL
jgi:hypothetical protein